jgi:hypothetical protein
MTMPDPGGSGPKLSPNSNFSFSADCTHSVSQLRTLPERVIHVVWLLAAIGGARNCSDIFVL